MEQFGLEYPIEIDMKGQILSGARRWRAAKKLGWKDIAVRVLKTKTDEEARKHILLANAYRSVKTVFTRQKETDAYRLLLARGEVTKEELASLARQHGKPPSTPVDLRPTRLAAAAAGISASTYQASAYVTDPRRGEAAIDSAAPGGTHCHGPGVDLEARVEEDSGGIEEGPGAVRRRPRTYSGSAYAKRNFSTGYTEQELSEKRANEAGVKRRPQGKGIRECHPTA